MGHITRKNRSQWLAVKRIDVCFGPALDEAKLHVIGPFPQKTDAAPAENAAFLIHDNMIAEHVCLRFVPFIPRSGSAAGTRPPYHRLGSQGGDS